MSTKLSFIVGSLIGAWLLALLVIHIATVSAVASPHNCAADMLSTKESLQTFSARLDADVSGQWVNPGTLEADALRTERDCTASGRTDVARSAHQVVLGVLAYDRGDMHGVSTHFSKVD